MDHMILTIWHGPYDMNHMIWTIWDDPNPVHDRSKVTLEEKVTHELSLLQITPFKIDCST